MVVDLRRSFSLLLLLGLWEPMCLLSGAHPKGLTKARWFEIQHIQTSPQQCHTAMSVVNNYTRHCKPKNTFLHDSFQNVTVACGSPNITCKNGQNNCHQSAGPVNMTDCALTGGTFPNCRYSSAVKFKFFIVACELPKNPPTSWSLCT